jgi:hypothetical protein
MVPLFLLPACVFFFFRWWVGPSISSHGEVSYVPGVALESVRQVFLPVLSLFPLLYLHRIAEEEGTWIQAEEAKPEEGHSPGSPGPGSGGGGPGEPMGQGIQSP